MYVYRDNNLGKWDAGPNGGTPGFGLGFGPDYTDEMSGKFIVILPSFALTLLSLSTFFLWYDIIIPVTLKNVL